ncbi:MAG: CcdB family protein [Hydrogenophaga sp.]|uniref:CcdB family protein n=1 Tax=Polaromonas sp. TaxID=1869339 RepID=UPI002489446D|nr:CcdB family protein [Polaromonas sp.]MDI1269358.1 CcdB family protein [Polaromonas sp.]MDP2449079.1 CcdB family protein [Polaromonas sp.]MDP3164430.1 CcdB family protein [Hydrogenophaga sp.]MDP3756885.1 CcdB family protein [Polaromonas sp.]
MARFDVFRNPNPRASHQLYLDVQSDLVSTATRWCIPLLAAKPEYPVASRAQGLLNLLDDSYVMDTPNLLSVPAALLRHPVGRLGPQEQALAEASIEFMLRGY